MARKCTELNKRYPDVFPTKKAAERYIGGLNLNPPFSNSALFRKQWIYRIGRYRLEGQPGKPRTVIIPTGFGSDLLERLAALHGGKVVKLVTPAPAPEPSVEPLSVVPEPAPDAPAPASSAAPAPAPADWTKIKLTCVWKNSRMLTKCNRPDIWDYPDGHVAGCRNCGGIYGTSTSAQSRTSLKLAGS